MKLRLALITLLFTLPVFATGALYQVKSGRLHFTEPGLSIDVRYPLISGLSAQADATFNSESKKRAIEVASEFEQEAREAYKEAPEAAGLSAQSLIVDFETKHLSQRLLTLLIHGSEYTGGAHPNSFYYILAIDPKSGRKIPVEDFFSGPKYLEQLSRLSAEALNKRTEELNTDSKWITEGTAPKADNFDVIWPGEDGLYILFTPYQVAPYSSGATSIIIPYSKLKGVLSDKYFDN